MLGWHTRRRKERLGDWAPLGLKLPIATKRFGWVIPGVIVAAVIVLYLEVIGTKGILLAVLPQALALILFSLGWNLVGGYAGQAALGNAAYFGIGAFVTVLAANQHHIVPIAGMWLGALVAMVAAVIIGFITLRFRNIYFALTSTVFPLIIGAVLTYKGYQEEQFPFKLDAGITYLGFGSEKTQALLIGFFVVAMVLVSSLVERSSSGLLMRSVRADEHAAAATGVAVRSVKIWALIASAGVCALAGALYSATILVITPDDFFSLTLSLEAVIFALVGGSGTLWGPVLGTGLLVPLDTVITTKLGATVPGIAPLLYGVALILVVLVFPGGIYWQVHKLIGHIVARNAAKGRERAPTAPVSPDGEPLKVQADAGALATSTPWNGSSVVKASSEPSLNGGKEVRSTEVLEIDGIQKAFGGLVVLEDITFRVGAAEIVGVIGPNGAGKTTLFDIISGFVKADGGSAVLGGRDILGLSPTKVCRAGIGRTFQTPRLFTGLTVGESVAVAARVRGERGHEHDFVSEALDMMSLYELRREPVESLTTGEVRRVELARAVVGWPKVVFLDEFLGGVGGDETELVLSGLREVRKRGCSIVAIEHTMHAMVGFVDRFVVLHVGRVLASGTAAEIAADPQVIEAYLGDRWVARASS